MKLSPGGILTSRLEEKGSILKELIFNQYQAILLGGVVAVSAIGFTPVPLLLWLGGELVLLPVLDSPPVRRLVYRRRRVRARKELEARRAQLIASFNPAFAKRYAEMETLCRQIEANYHGLHGISQTYVSEQRDKLDMILDCGLQRMVALQRYERMLSKRDLDDLAKEISRLEKEKQQPELTERARVAVEKNRELKQRLHTAHQEARGTMKALASELDSMASLLEVLHQNSLSMRDPQAISHELDMIVRQSEDSERAVREMEALLRSGGAEWLDGMDDAVFPVGLSSRPSAQNAPTGTIRQKARNQ